MLGDIWIIIWILIAFVAIGFWESSVEGRNSWDKKKHGWKVKLGKQVILTRYHFFVFWVMTPVFLGIPLIMFGWDPHVFGILLVSFFLGMVVEDFTWYLTNPVVKTKEFWTSFSNYYPWIKIKGKKIIPWGYLAGILAAILSWVIFL